MARNRNSENAWLPPRVYRGKSAYEFHPVGGGALRLCDLSASQADVWRLYELAAMDKPLSLGSNIFSELVRLFMQSPDFFELAAETQRDYTKYSRKVLSVFGAMPPNDIEPQHIRIYMDKRGLNSRVQANREKSFMSRVFRWGYERGFAKQNPCSGVKQFKETARKRYITDAEYMAVLNAAPPYVQVAMEIAYLCCARQADVLSMQEWQIQEEGIYIKQGKTGVEQVKMWTDRLRSAVTLAHTLSLNSGMVTQYLIHQPNGSHYTRNGFNSAWALSRAKAKADNPDLSFDFTFHDLKAKGISDLDGDLRFKQRVSGHMNASQTRRYDRKISKVVVVGGEDLSRIEDE